MDTILVANSGSSSVKFQVFAIAGERHLKRLIRGQVDGIGFQPRLRVVDGAGVSKVDRQLPSAAATDVPTGLRAAGDWLREQEIVPIAVGHRVVHGGPEFDRPVLIDADVLRRLEGYVPLAPLHQPSNLAAIRAV